MTDQTPSAPDGHYGPRTTSTFREAENGGQTPTTEDVELLNMLTGALLDAAQEDDNNFIPFTKRTHYAKAIMARLAERDAARDRETAAKALRDAAEALPEYDLPFMVNGRATIHVYHWLNDRADRIRPGHD